MWLQVALTLTLRETEGSQISYLSFTQEARKIDEMKSKIGKGRVETIKQKTEKQYKKEMETKAFFHEDKIDVSRPMNQEK